METGRGYQSCGRSRSPLAACRVMDGLFVPSISYGMPVLKAVRSHTDMFLDVHLMIEEPGRYIDDLAEVGADLITVHARHVNTWIARSRQSKKRDCLQVWH